MKALMPHAAAYGIDAEHLLAVIEGCQMDLEQSRYLDFAGLARYCHLVAGVVGEVAANIFGRTRARRPSTTRTSSAWRCSSPTSSATSATTRAAAASTCRSTSCSSSTSRRNEILNRGYSDRFTALMRFQAERAHRCYDEAFALLPEADRARRSPA